MRALAFALMVLMSVSWVSAARASEGRAYVLDIEGAIGPATSAYMLEGLEKAKQDQATIVVMRLDTPGGLDTSMREIIRAILDSRVPVVAYVHPSGSRAASAGTYLIYASHFAAMTPGTNLGAATPIQIGGGSAPPGKGEGNDEQTAPSGAAERKVVNDAVAYLRSLAELRGRNADWAEQAVREGASLSANSALELGVIEIVTNDLDQLFQELDGRSVEIRGEIVELETKNLEAVELEPDWVTKFLGTITDPNVALILLMIGIYGIFFEFLNPGALVPGIIGAISLLIALYALAALPVDFAGIGLIVLGLSLLLAEAFAPSFGILGLGGIASFAFGAAILFDTDMPEFRVDWPVIAALAVFGAVVLILVARLGISSFRRPVKGGREELIGAQGEVADWDEGSGHIVVHSERWNATGPRHLPVGGNVTIVGIDGLQLSVIAETQSKPET